MIYKQKELFSQAKWAILWASRAKIRSNIEANRVHVGLYVKLNALQNAIQKQNACWKKELQANGARKSKCGENRNHGKFKIYFLMVEL